MYSRFAAGQYYEYDAYQTHVYTVQVAATSSLSGAESIRNSMLQAGYDSFVYLYKGAYRVMCGKFREQYDAMAYSESIHGNTDKEHAYVTNAYLPSYAVDSFEQAFYGAVTISTHSRDMETFWEKPTGAFLRGNDPDTVKVYTVQLATGTSFQGSETLRDNVTAQGYPAFVYKSHLSYKIMVGMFYDKAEAQRFQERIVRTTDQSGAVVGTAYVPGPAVDTFAYWLRKHP